MLPSISVIVPVYNGEKFLGRCLDAIFGSDHAPLEVLVVDDCSTDGSAALAQGYGASVISMEKNSGPGRARNFAAKQARGEVLLFVDADVVVKPETIGLIASAFEANPEISALFGSYDDEPAETNFLSQYKNLQHHFVHQTSSPEASTFWAGLGAVRRDVFLALGGFDYEKFAVPSIEDIELGLRLRKAGHRILLAREIQATHLKRWEPIQLIKTEVFCRAIPWSKLIVTSKELINDMNLKTADRLSAGFVALSIAVVPLLVWQPLVAVLLLLVFLGAVAVLNREILGFYLRKRGILFAAAAYPWLWLYFFYSGASFGYCWFRYGLLGGTGIREKHGTEQT